MTETYRLYCVYHGVRVEEEMTGLHFAYTAGYYEARVQALKERAPHLLKLAGWMWEYEYALGTDLDRLMLDG